MEILSMMHPSVDATRVIQADAKSCRRPGALQGLDSQRETENESAEGPQSREYIRTMFLVKPACCPCCLEVWSLRYSAMIILR